MGLIISLFTNVVQVFNPIVDLLWNALLTVAYVVQAYSRKTCSNHIKIAKNFMKEIAQKSSAAIIVLYYMNKTFYLNTYKKVKKHYKKLLH